MPHPGTFPPMVISVAAFLKRREPWLRHAKREQLLQLVNWYWRDGRVGVVRREGRIVAVALARASADLRETRANPWYHDEQGNVVWVEHIAATTPEGVPVLFGLAAQRFGKREAYAGEVFKRGGELRMLPSAIIERIAGGQIHGFTINSRPTSGT
jgi:hypothetical protein